MLLVIEIEAKTIFVLDGLTYNLKTWSDHIMYALKVLGIIGQQETSRRLLSFPRGDTPFEYKVHKNVKRRVWEVRRHGTSMTQRDYHSCGPLMCWNVEAYCSETNTKIPSDHMQVRRDVVTKYEEFVNDFREDLRVYTLLPDVWDGEAWQSGRKVVDGGSIADSISIIDAVPENPVSKERRGKMANLVLSSDEDGAGAGTPPRNGSQGKIDPLVLSSDDDDDIPFSRVFPPKKEVEAVRTPPKSRNPTRRSPRFSKGMSKVPLHITHPKEGANVFPDSSVRRSNMVREAVRHQESVKRRVFQDQQALSMVKRRRHNLPVLSIGSLVTVKPEPQQRAGLSTRGILAVVYQVNDFGTVRVACEHGVIATSNNHPLALSHDKYQLRKSTTPIFGRIQTVRDDILQRKFVPSTFPKITVAACCQKLYGGQIGLPSCKCHPSKGCSAKCGCRRKNLGCSSRCRCLGRCEYTATKNASFATV